MSSVIPGLTPLAYSGVKEANPPNIVIKNAPPTTTDYNGFDIGDMWVDKLLKNVYVLANKITRPNRAGTAFWRLITEGGSGGFTWVEVTGTSAQMEVGTGYIANNAALVSLTLPAQSFVGDMLFIVGKGAGLWSIVQGAGQFINLGATISTTGAGGSVTSLMQFDSLCLVCTVESTGWTAFGSIGNFTVV